MTDLRHVLVGMNIVIQNQAIPFIYVCQCDYPEWTKFMKLHTDALKTDSRIDSRWDESLDDHQQPLIFNVMVYQARWAQGRYGIKVKESTGGFPSRIYKSVQHTLEADLNTFIRTRKAALAS